jgi:hypothetical protein
VLASACKAIELDAARLALRVPVINPQAVESVVWEELCAAHYKPGERLPAIGLKAGSQPIYDINTLFAVRPQRRPVLKLISPTPRGFQSPISSVLGDGSVQHG